MINVSVVNNELIVTGEVLPGETYKNLCCKGFDYDICATIIDIWGACWNPKCPRPDGISNHGLLEFADKVYDRCQGGIDSPPK